MQYKSLTSAIPIAHIANIPFDQSYFHVEIWQSLLLMMTVHNPSGFATNTHTTYKQIFLNFLICLTNLLNKCSIVHATSENNEHCDIDNACLLKVIGLELRNFCLAIMLTMLSTHTRFVGSIDIPIVQTRRCLDCSINCTVNIVTAQYTPIMLPTPCRIP